MREARAVVEGEGARGPRRLWRVEGGGVGGVHVDVMMMEMEKRAR